MKKEGGKMYKTTEEMMLGKRTYKELEKKILRLFMLIICCLLLLWSFDFDITLKNFFKVYTLFWLLN